MKLVVLNILICNLFIFCSFGQTFNDSEADSLRNIANSFYETNPSKCISYLDRAAGSYEKIGNKTQQAFCFNNIAFAYYEKLDNLDSSIFFIDKAILIWTELNNPINLANILKYYGMLQGKRKEFEKGIKSINQAINLFEKVNFKAGIAVSYFDKALLFESQNELDSCIIYLNKNKSYFESVHDTSRIFVANNKLFKIFTSDRELDLALEIYENNLKMENSSKVYWQHLIDFYRISLDYSELLKDSVLYEMYLEKYKQLNDSLTKQGIIVK